MATFDHDLFVIGAGSGGVRASRIASSLGAKVAVAEEFRVGGTCVIRGCVPKKLMVYASHFHEDFEDAAGFGWSVGETSFDWKKLIANKDKEIDRLNGLYKQTLNNAGVDILETRAEVLDEHTVDLGDRKVTAETILVATGGTPNMPNIPGAEYAISSNEVFHLEEFPNRILICGGGYIAVEFAGIFAGLGAEVTLLYRGHKILRGFDETLRDKLTEAMQAKGIKIICGAVTDHIEKTPAGLKVTLSNGQILNVDQAMYAIGRAPNTTGLGLDKAGVYLEMNGAVCVDSYSKTNIDSIWAVGDVTDRIALTPVAIKEGHAFAQTRYGNRPTEADHHNVPSAVFSQPPIGTVGLTEEEAMEKLGDVFVYESDFRAMKNTLSGRQERSFAKLVVDCRTDRVVGCHMIGPDSPEIIQAVGIAVKMGATKAQFDATVAVHPSTAEELVLMTNKRKGGTLKAA